MGDLEILRWDELIPEVLGLIFRNLPLQEKLVVIPSVCKSWRKIVLEPFCWEEIDILQWSQLNYPRLINRMLVMLIPRSAGSLQKLCVTGLSVDSTLSLITEHGKALHTLRLPGSLISNSMGELIAERLSALTYLDVSFCTFIRAPALEAIGKHCANLTRLQRVMFPCEGDPSRDDEALAIASTMHKLKHLQISFLCIGTESVVTILENCSELEFLDVQGCENVDLDEDFFKQFPRVKVIGPFEEDNHGLDDYMAFVHPYDYHFMDGVELVDRGFYAEYSDTD